jgi:hypothetical protein
MLGFASTTPKSGLHHSKGCVDLLRMQMTSTNQPSKSMILFKAESHPQREIILRGFYGQTRVYQNTIHFDGM